MSVRNFENKLVISPVTEEDRNFIREELQKILETVKTEYPPRYLVNSNFDCSIYVGASGIAYMFLKAAKYFDDKSVKKEFMDHAHNYINSIKINRLSNKRGIYKDNALFCGDSGIHLIAYLVFKESNMDKQAKKEFESFISLESCTSTCLYDELLVGRAGYLLGFATLLKSNEITSDVEQIIKKILKIIIKNGVEYSKVKKSSLPLLYSYHETDYLGLIHGVAGIMLILIKFNHYLSSDEQSLVKETVYGLLKLEENGHYPSSTESRKKGSDRLIHLCHGAPGMIYLLLVGYKLWSDDQLLEAAKRCGELIWDKGLLTKGPGLCHGIAGNAYCFLYLNKLTNNEIWLNRAWKFASFMFTKQFIENSRVPDRPLSLYEGLSGTACFLMDLLNMDHLELPIIHDCINIIVDK